MAALPLIEDAVAAKVPVPENEHVGNSLMLPAGTLNVADRSSAPEIVPVKTALTRTPSPTSTTTGPEMLAPFCVAIHDVSRNVWPGRAAGRTVPVHVPERLRTGAGAGAAVGVGAATGGGAAAVGAVGVLPPPHAVVAATAKMEISRFIGIDAFLVIAW